MKFTVSTTSLLKHLQLLSGAVGSNKTSPISENFIFHITDGTLRITATDMETSMSSELDIIADEDGNVAIPAKMLLDILKSLPDQPLTFKISETYSVEILAKSGKYKLAGQEADAFLDLMEMGEAETLSLSSNALSYAISKTAFAAGTDDLRPAMTGVYVHTDSNKLIFVATDAQKLARFSFEDDQTKPELAFILPRKALNTLKGALPNNDTEVQLSYNPSHAFFSFEGIKLICRLIDARFPDYKVAIPLNNENHLFIDRAELLASIKRLSIFANKNNYQIVLDIAADQLKLQTQDPDYANEASEKLDCRYEGDDMQIAFNARYLAELVGAIDSEEVQFDLSAPNRAAILMPPNQSQEENLMLLIMPLLIM